MYLLQKMILFSCRGAGVGLRVAAVDDSVGVGASARGGPPAHFGVANYPTQRPVFVHGAWRLALALPVPVPARRLARRRCQLAA